MICTICQFYWEDDSDSNQQAGHRDDVDGENSTLDQNSCQRSSNHQCIATNATFVSSISVFYLVNHSTLQLSLRLFGGNDGQSTDNEEFEFRDNYETSIKKAKSSTFMALLRPWKTVDRPTQPVKHIINRVTMSPIVDNGLGTDDAASSKRRKWYIE